MNHELTILDHLRETGICGLLSIVVFLGGIAFAGWIHFRYLSLRYRVAFIPYSMLPLMIGIFGLAVGTIRIIHTVSEPAVRPDAYLLADHFGEILQIVPLATLETIVLLLISVLLFLGRKSPRARP